MRRRSGSASRTADRPHCGWRRWRSRSAVSGGGRRHHLPRLEARRRPARPGSGTDRLRSRRPLPDELERTLRRRRIKALYCMPVAHLPMGWVMPPQRCRAIAELARKHDFALIEDLTYRHLRPKASTGLYRLAPERTWLVGSMSGLLGDGCASAIWSRPTRTGGSWKAWPCRGGLRAAAHRAGAALAGGRHRRRDPGAAGGACARIVAGRRPHGAEGVGVAVDGGLGLVAAGRPGRRAEDLVSRLRRAGVDAIGSEPFSVAPLIPTPCWSGCGCWPGRRRATGADDPGCLGLNSADRQVHARAGSPDRRGGRAARRKNQSQHTV